MSETCADHNDLFFQSNEQKQKQKNYTRNKRALWAMNNVWTELSN